jgi:hypothetical protein
MTETKNTVAISSQLTTLSASAEILAKSRPDWSDKNGLATGRKSRLEAVFAFVELWFLSSSTD